MMKKRIISKVAVFTMAAALALPATVYAAAPTTAPIEVSVKQDGKTHKVFVFGQSLALVSTDGSIEISTMGPVGRVDVMIDGVLTKNVSSIDIPANQQTKMVLDENSIIVKNVTAQSGEAIKKQISDAYASGAVSIDLASLGNVTAYQINADGEAINASGNAVSSSVIGMSVSSTDAAVVAFTAEIAEIKAETAITARAEQEALTAEIAASKVLTASDDDNKEEVKKPSSTDGSSTTTPANPTTPKDPEPEPEPEPKPEPKPEPEPDK